MEGRADNAVVDDGNMAAIDRQITNACHNGCTGFAEVECAVADAAGTVAEIDEIGFMIAVKGVYIRFFARLVPGAAFAEHHVT